MVKKKKTAFGLIRVSTSSQELQSQKDALKKVAKEYGFTIADYGEGRDFFSEKISGYDDYWKSPVCVTPKAQVPLTLESKFRMTPIKS